MRKISEKKQEKRTEVSHCACETLDPEEIINKGIGFSGDEIGTISSVFPIMKRELLEQDNVIREG